jgi:2-phosphosulfolactate phosphatase
MNIQIIEGVEGAQQAKNIAIIIDVLRAATVSAYLLDAGVSSIIPVSSSDDAFDYKRANSDVLLVGEDRGIKIPGFDIGNSPSEIKQRNDLHGKQVVHRSSTGTQGLVNAQNAQQIIFGSFVTAGAILNYLKNQPTQNITLVPMYALEDQLFAEYLRDHLGDSQPTTIEMIKDRLSQHEWLKTSFLDPNNHNFPEDDFHLSLEIDVFDFFPVVQEGKIIKSTQL